MSNLTSASGDQASASPSFASPNSNPNPNPNPTKKKRNLPGNPDPDAEVIALSPKSLMATNRFLCEICNKGFQRDQNLQLHRRGHNLPWKLKQRTSKEVKKRVYICPETSCVHHDPSRALGDLTGIKKHFSRKHGEKKWRCDKCSKKYAVQSDWKAHSKICGTREYRCDCGTLFSWRDSFVTHRAFCDALAEESAKTNIATNNNNNNNNNTLQANNNNNHHPLLFSQMQTAPLDPMAQFSSLQDQLSLKRESNYNELNMRPDHDIPPWLACEQLQSSIYASSQEFSQDQHQNSSMNPPVSQALSQPSAHMSATALLQIAAQMGATMTKPSLLMNQGMIMASSGLDHGPFGESFMVSSSSNSNSKREGHEGGYININNNNNSNGNDGMTTRDFLGLRGGAMSHREMILNMAGLDHCMSSSSNFNEQKQQNKKP